MYLNGNAFVIVLFILIKESNVFNGYMWCFVDDVDN